MRIAHTVITCSLITGCSHWTRTEVASPSRQVGSVLVGEPHLEETTTSDSATDYAELAGTDGQVSFVAGSVDRAGRTVRRTRCVQKALIDLEQDVELRPVVAGRSYDVLGAVGLAVLGGIVAGVAHSDYGFDRETYQSKLEFHERDPSFFPRPTEPDAPTGWYATGAGLGVAGLSVLTYSLLGPRGAKPKTERLRRRWTEETYVDATGCGS